jgi:putative ABC transport system permease protein
MLFNYLLVAVRNFQKYKGYAFVNILGLSTGIACSLLIFLWTSDEMSMDKFHNNDDRLYVVIRNMHLSNGDVLTTKGIPHPLTSVLQDEYPEVEGVTTISWAMEYLFELEGTSTMEKGRYVKPEFFDVLAYRLLEGDQKTALIDNSSIVLSERLAEKYFGNKTALGQTIRVANKDLKVTGIVANPGTNSSLQFDWLLPETLFISQNSWVEDWHNGSFSIVLTLREGTDASAFSKKFEQEINEHINNEADERLSLQKYSDQYLHGTFVNGVNTGGRIDYVVMLTIVAIFTIVIACVNFMNLATARSVRRSQEIGLRKVMGAGRLGLGIQFLTEATVISFGSVVFAVVAAILVLPYFNNLTGKSMTVDFTDPRILLALTGVALATGFVSGSYPALLLPSFRITNSLKGAIKHTASAKFFRKGLVVFQFGLSIVLLVGTLAVTRQMDFIFTKNVGLNKENVMFIDLTDQTDEGFPTYKDELLKIPGISSVTSTSGNPLNYGRSSSSPVWEGKNPDEEVEINILTIGSDFRQTLKTEILQGRDFSDDLSTDSLNYVINEEAARLMGFADPIGKSLRVWGRSGQIIGVIRSFHMSSLYNPIAPLIIRYDPTGTSVALIRIGGDTQETLQAVEKVTRGFNPSRPFTYKFLDQEFEATYRSEQIIGVLVRLFAGLAIFISCLGLLGLCAFSAEQRKKELGIRKVHGASAPALVMLLSRDYGTLIVIAIAIASPLAWYLADQWLNRFTFRTSIGFGELALAGFITVVIAGVTVGVKSLQAALLNPVETLREQ